METQKHTISCLVENHFGVLARVSGLISARGFNIDSLTVSETEDPTLSRMTIVVDGDDRTLEQVKKQLNRLIDVVKVQELSRGEFIDRELMLVRVSAQAKQRTEVLKTAEVFQGKPVDVDARHITLEFTGDGSKMNSVLEVMQPYGIVEVVRTGRVAMARGASPEALVK